MAGQGVLVSRDVDVAIHAIAAVAAAHRRREHPLPFLALDHRADIAAVAIAAHVAVGGAHFAVFIGSRAAHEPAWADFTLATELVGHRVVAETRRALAAVLVGSAPRDLAPEAILLAGKCVDAGERGARHHCAGELPKVCGRLHGGRGRDARRQVGHAVLIGARPHARSLVQLAKQRRQGRIAAGVPDALKVIRHLPLV
ncbi:hypothetical protein D3C87_1316570 [compost metagenome]